MTRSVGTGDIPRRRVLAGSAGALLAGCMGRDGGAAPTADDGTPDAASSGAEYDDETDGSSTSDDERNPEPDPDFTVGSATWTMAGRDAANTGYNPDGRGPPDADGSRWRRDVDGVYTLTSPAVSEAGVYVASRHSVYGFDPAVGERQWTATPVEYTEGSEDAYAAPSGLLTHSFSPVVTEEVVVGGAREYEDTRGGVEPGVLFGLDEETGAEQWVVESHVTTSPTAADGGLFVGETGGDTAAIRRFDPQSGEETWRTPLAGPGQDPRLLGAPAVVDGLLLAAVFDRDLTDAARTELVALDAASGDRRGTVEFEGAVELPPVVNDGRVFLATRDGVVHALDVERADGSNANGADDDAIEFTAAWTHDTLEDVDDAGAVDGSFAFADGTVYVVANATLHALAADDGAERWTATLPYDLDVAMAVGSDAVYVAGSVLIAFGPDDGERLWERRIGSNGGEFSGPAVAGDALYVAACLKTERADYIYDNDVRAFY